MPEDGQYDRKMLRVLTRLIKFVVVDGYFYKFLICLIVKYFDPHFCHIQASILYKINYNSILNIYVVKKLAY
jgi:hypothetical protein